MPTKILYCDETWNPIVGCSKVSPGCANCYAERMAYRLACIGVDPYTQGVVRGVGDDGGPMKEQWTGQIGIANDKVWAKPLHWRKPRRIFVCSMGDLFHKNVSFETIDRVFAIMALCPQHTFQCLSKRADRMREYVGWRSIEPDMIGRYDRGQKVDASGYVENHICGFTRCRRWPLPNVWLGVTAENQATADERVPILLATPAAVRFVSCEPLLGPVDLTRIETVDGYGFGFAHPFEVHPHLWVIAGGESGPRHMHPDWARSLRDQCQESGVPFYMKQMSGTTQHERENIPPDLMIREFPGGREL